MKRLIIITLSIMLTGYVGYTMYNTMFCSSNNLSATCTIDDNTSLADQKVVFQKSMGAMCQKACGAKNYKPEAVIAQKDAKVGDLTTCPVSGVVFEVKEGSTIVSHSDQSFYTCCGSCGKIFNKTPEVFLSNI